MDKSTITNFFRNMQTSISRNSPAILTGIGIAGMIGTTIMAVQATPKALRIIEDKQFESGGDTLPPIEVVKVTWKYYIPAAVTGIVSVACLIKANSISTRRSAALVTAYNLSKTAFTEYKDKVIENIGDKKEQTVIDGIAKDKLEKNPVEKRNIIETTTGPTRCYDGLFGRCFYSSKDDIERAVIRLNRRITTDMYVSLNELYFELDLPPVEMGDSLGWNFDDGELKVEYSSIIDTDGTPCLVMSFNVAPKYDFFKII